jgi:hypothetical protein
MLDDEDECLTCGEKVDRATRNKVHRIANVQFFSCSINVASYGCANAFGFAFDILDDAINCATPGRHSEPNTTSFEENDPS